MDKKNAYLTPNCPSNRLIRSSPLPQLNWGDPFEIWESMVVKDEKYKRDVNILNRHQSLTPIMRSILLDWLSEVSEYFQLHRETYYLAVDFVDRYLSNERDIPRHRLQLIGVTSLFVAAKIEEIYPPKLSEVAYITDGACTEDDIINQELVIMDALQWSLHPFTVNKWLSLFIQIYSILDNQDNRDPEARTTGDSFLIPNYNHLFFAQISHLVDLCMLDIGCLSFEYDIIAASAFYHFTDEKIVYDCTHLNINDIRDCVIWLTPFAIAIRDSGFEELKVKDHANWCMKQYHTVDLALLEKAHSKKADLDGQEDSSELSIMPPSPVSSPSTSKGVSATKRRYQSLPLPIDLDEDDRDNQPVKRKRAKVSTSVSKKKKVS